MIPRGPRRYCNKALVTFVVIVIFVASGFAFYCFFCSSLLFLSLPPTVQRRSSCQLLLRARSFVV